MTNLKGKISEKKLDTLIRIGLILTVIWAALGCSPNLISRACPGRDSSVFITIAKGMHNGLVPYRDFFDHKGPLLYFINYVGLMFKSMLGIWFIELVFLSVTMFFCYKVALLFSEKKAAFISAVFSFVLLAYQFEGGNLSEEYAMPFIALSLYLFLKAFKEEKDLSIMNTILIGMSFGAILMLRPNMIGVWAGFSCVIVISKFYKKDFKNAFSYILFFALGTIVLVTPFLVYLYSNNALNDFIAQYLLFNSKYATRGSLLARETVFFNFLSSGLVWVALLSAILPFVVMNGKRIEKNLKIGIAYALSIVFSLILISFSRSYYPHYSMVLIPLIVPALSYFSQIILKTQKSLCFLVLIFVLAFCSSAYSFFRLPISVLIPNKQDIFYISDAILKNTKPDDKITVLGNTCQFYYYSRASVSKYIYQLPIGNIDTSIMREYETDIFENKPAVIVAARDQIIRNPDDGTYLLNKPFDKLSDFVSAQYEEIYSEYGWVLMKRIEQ